MCFSTGLSSVVGRTLEARYQPRFRGAGSGLTLTFCEDDGGGGSGGAYSYAAVAPAFYRLFRAYFAGLE